MKSAIEVPLFPYALFQVIHGSVLLKHRPYLFSYALLQELGRKVGTL